MLVNIFIGGFFILMVAIAIYRIIPFIRVAKDAPRISELARKDAEQIISQETELFAKYSSTVVDLKLVTKQVFEKCTENERKRLLNILNDSNDILLQPEEIAERLNEAKFQEIKLNQPEAVKALPMTADGYREIDKLRNSAIAVWLELVSKPTSPLERVEHWRLFAMSLSIALAADIYFKKNINQKPLGDEKWIN